MPYPALPGRRMPYDVDGTVVAHADGGPSTGVQDYPSGTVLGHLQQYVDPGVQYASGAAEVTIWFFQPEQRTVAGLWEGYDGARNGGTMTIVLEGSNDTSNGMDGTWETASFPSGVPASFDYATVDAWRNHIKPVSFTAGKSTFRLRTQNFGTGQPTVNIHQIHLYGAKIAGQTPDDILFMDSDDGGAEFGTPEDFGDRPLGTSVIRQFKIKNSSASKTASTILLQCNDTDFVISDSASGPWVTSYTVASLGPGTQSVTLYIRNTTPNPGAALGPRFARIIATVGSWA